MQVRARRCSARRGAARGDVGDPAGHVTGEGAGQVCGHARAVAAVAQHGEGEAVATAGEDGAVNVWGLEGVSAGGRELAAEASRAVRDALLCGVAFGGAGGRELVLLAHDSDVLTVLQQDP